MSKQLSFKDYISGPSSKPFVLYGAAGSGKSALLSKVGNNHFHITTLLFVDENIKLLIISPLQTALMSLKEWLAPAVPLLMCRFCGTTPNSTALGPLLKSICQQICYCDMLPFEV